jgi:prepilin-type N-terminal cleavage/methylation domain-containing protein
MRVPSSYSKGFTLIELSIVLVIIGLLVGGVLVGQSLISAAGVRATITQIEKFNTAANTFREKYGYLPGDIPDPDASNFGFAARGQYAGQGDGNGVLQGNSTGTAGNNAGNQMASGETGMFWVDLSAANLIEGNFNTATATTIIPNVSASEVPSYFPPAKIGGGNYIYVYSGGVDTAALGTVGDGLNYFGLSAVNGTLHGTVTGPPGLTVQQAYVIDTKIDDGLPQSGRVTAMYLDRSFHDNDNTVWAGAGETAGPNPPYITPTPSSSKTCFDNGWSTGTQHYSIEVSNGSNVNCALSFRMQAGD